MHTYQNLLHLTQFEPHATTRFPFKASGLYTNLNNLRALTLKAKDTGYLNTYLLKNSAWIQRHIKSGADSYKTDYHRGSS